MAKKIVEKKEEAKEVSTVECPVVAIGSSEALSLVDYALSLKDKFEKSANGNREVDLSVEDAVKSLNHVVSLALFIDKALKEKKK